MLRYFLGDEVDGATGMHLRRLGDVGLISGSKSMVLFRVAPHAITLTCQKLDLSEKTKRQQPYIPAVTFLLSNDVTYIVFYLTKNTQTEAQRSGFLKSYR